MNTPVLSPRRSRAACRVAALPGVTALLVLAVAVVAGLLLLRSDDGILMADLAPAPATWAATEVALPESAANLAIDAPASAGPSATARTELAAIDPEAPLGDLLVVVEAPAGQGQDVPLALTWTATDNATEVVWEQPTDARATAHFPRRLCTPRERTVVPCIDLAFPSSGAHAMQFDATTERVSLFVPEQGNLRIEVVEADGTPIRAGAVAELRVLQTPPPAARSHFRGLTRGQTLVAMEAAGLLLEVAIRVADGRRSEAIVVTGPGAPGAVVACLVHMAPRALFSARILDRDCRPMANQDVEVWLAGPLCLAHGPTNGKGVVTFAGPPPGWRGQALPLVFLARREDGVALHATLAADLRSPAGGSLGSVRLQDCPLLCSGVCVDADGQPVPGLELVVQMERPAELRGHGLLRGSTWTDLTLRPVRGALDGTFRIYGPPQYGRSLKLRVRGQGDLAVPFVEGTPDVRVALPRPRARTHARL